MVCTGVPLDEFGLEDVPEEACPIVDPEQLLKLFLRAGAQVALPHCRAAAERSLADGSRKPWRSVEAVDAAIKVDGFQEER